MHSLSLNYLIVLFLISNFTGNSGHKLQTFDYHNFSTQFSEAEPVSTLLNDDGGSFDETKEKNPVFDSPAFKDDIDESDQLNNDEYIARPDPDEKQDFFQYPDGFDETEDAKTFKHQEYEENPLGTSLAAFGSKISAKDVGSTLPVFLDEPQNSFVVKNKPVTLKCKAAYALQVHFKCSGSSEPPPSVPDSHVDPHSGVHIKEVTATIHRDLVDEYFGKTPFQCECQAWSSRGVTKSQAATINVAYIRKQFAVSPTSLRVEIGSRAELHCKPPNGIPSPTIQWYKNDFPILDVEGIEITADKSLVLNKVSLQDMANYTCYAENIAGKRISDSAVLIVYVNGGWSAWSPWKDCKCIGMPSQGRKRSRICNNPMPLNGGIACNGPQIQKSSDCLSCPEDIHIINSDGSDVYAGRWSVWGEWSSCSAECIQVRRRKCITHSVDDALMDSGSAHSLNNGFVKSLCSGKDFQTSECRGGLCRIGKSEFDWALYLGLAFIAVVCMTFGVAVICFARRGITNSPDYNIARTVLESKYVGSSDKKMIHRNYVADGNVNYDYANPGHTSLSGEQAVSEHHYDVPNLSANYTNPIDGISVDYISDTAETSTCTSDSTDYDYASKQKCLSVSKRSCKMSSIKDVFNEAGGYLRLYEGKVSLYVPEFALGNYDKKGVSVAVLGEEFSRINVKSFDSMLITSTIVSCTPLKFNFLKPCILKIPHCLTEPSLWNISVYSSEASNNDINVKWETITKIGVSTNTSKFFIKVDKHFAYIMTERMGRFAILAQPDPSIENLSIEMKLLAFGQVAPNCAVGSLRVYIVKDFPNSCEICSRIESQLGGSFMGESETFSFSLNESDLNIRIRSTGEWEVPSHLQEQVIPYNHILSNNSILHCEFNLRRKESHFMDISLEIDFSQTNSENDYNSFAVPQTRVITPVSPDNERQVVFVNKRGRFINEIYTDSKIPREIKNILCVTLDPLRVDKNDWRTLSIKLNLLEYIEYGASRPNPTENLLNLWECRSTNEKNIHDLVRILKEMHRDDVVDLIEKSVGPIWL
ncbi:netrin receptor unc-5 isoform X2 [Eupeodes corollae]|uniref:netrin receptor unc-5 isoform X2 n=1 Tax=Eupeodes corollae TaxID=290404 RepID=UPI00249220AB|nr:netrin receptor unc-5 isoform X2 [Eupeodes corollae]